MVAIDSSLARIRPSRRPPGLFEHPTLGTNAAPLLSWQHMGAGWARGRWSSSRDAPEGIVHPQPTPTACALLSASKQGWGQPLLRPTSVLACCVALSWAQYAPLRGIVRDHHAPRQTGPRLLICCLWRARGRPRAHDKARASKWGRARGRFFGPLWPAVWDLLAVSLDRYVSPTIYLGGGSVALPDLSELGCRRPQTRPPCALSSGPLFERARRFVRSNASQSNKASEQSDWSAGFLLVRARDHRFSSGGTRQGNVRHWGGKNGITRSRARRVFQSYLTRNPC